MRILGLGTLKSGVCYHRIYLPNAALHLKYEHVTFKMTNNIDEAELEKGWDIVIMNRCVDFDTKKWERWKAKYGFTFVVDNDDYWELDPSHVLADHYHYNQIAANIKAYIEVADICTVTHSRLADEVYKINKNVHVIPNALPYGYDQFNPEKLKADKVRLFWSGSDTHAADISILRHPMKKVFADKQLRDSVRTVMSGYYERAKPVWDVMASAFTHALQFDSTIYQYAETDKYMHAYCDSDISIIPLQYSKFNGFKSNLKVLEAAAKHNPCIVSQVDPYLDMPVCYVPTQQYWYRWIKELVNDEAMRIEKGNELFDFCNTHFNLLTLNKTRYGVYSSNGDHSS